MFYGLPSNRRAGLDNERRRYTPWQGGSFGGSLCFAVEKTEYRLERFFGAKEKDDRFALYHLATGNPSTRYSAAIGEELFGVDADGFERSLYISQSLPFLPPDNNSIRARLGALLDASDDLGKFEKADELLDDARRHYRAQGERGLIPELSLAIREKETAIADARTAEETARALAEERQAIEEKKGEIAAALTEAREKRIEAEKRRIWDEQSASYRSLLDLREATRGQLLPFEEFFAPHLPTDEELLAAEQDETETTTLSAQLAHARLSEEEEATLARLSARYGENAPDGTFMDGLRDTLTAWRRAKEKRRATEARIQAQKDPVYLRFEAHTPTEGERAAIRAAKDALEDAGAYLYADAKPERPSLSLILSAVGSGLFAAVSVLGFVLSLLALAIPALVLTVASFVFLVLQWKKRGRPTSSGASRLEEYRVRQRRLAFLLTPFGYTEKDPLLCAARFFDDLARYEMSREEEAALRQALEEQSQKESVALMALTAYFKEADVPDPEAEASRIEAEIPILKLLLQKRADLATRRTLLSASLDAAAGRLQAFLSHYPALEGVPPRTALDTVKQNMLLSKQALDAYTAARNRVANYLQNTRFDPDAPPPPYQGDARGLEEAEQALQRALTDLEALSSVKANERAHLLEIAATIPTLIAEKEALEKEKAEAEHTLSLILTTKTLLKDAKDDLATRYLRDMEMHFDRYYQKLTVDPSAEMPADGSRVTSFSMDTSLALSCEAYGERRPVGVLSRGERDLAFFAARLSLLESIFHKEAPFLLLDDPFINLDDGNYEKAARLLSQLAERYQIVYTVCSVSRLPAELPLKKI